MSEDKLQLGNLHFCSFFNGAVNGNKNTFTKQRQMFSFQQEQPRQKSLLNMKSWFRKARQMDFVSFFFEKSLFFNLVSPEKGFQFSSEFYSSS